MVKYRGVFNIENKNYRKQELLGNIPDESQIKQFQDIQFQTPTQHPVVEALYPTISKPSPYAYRPHQSQLPPKQDLQPSSQQTPQYPGQSSPQQQPFISQDVCNQRYQPTHGPQYAHKNQQRHSDHQLAPTRISNQAPPISKVRKDCECIFECSTASTLPTQALPIQVPMLQVLPIQAPSVLAPSMQAPPIQLPPAQVPPAQEPPVQAPSIQAPGQKKIAGLLEKNVSKVVTP